MNQEMHETSIDVLTKSEARDLERLESVIQSSLNEMEALGKAFKEIRDRKLYRSEFSNFKDYVLAKWATSWRHAYQLCAAADVLENLKEGAQIEHLPKREGQLRELAKLEPEEQVQVWTEAVKTGNTSAKGIAETVEVILPERCKKQPKAEPRRKGSFADWQRFRSICIQMDELADELAGLVVDAPRIIAARDAATSVCHKLEKVIDEL